MAQGQGPAGEPWEPVGGSDSGRPLVLVLVGPTAVGKTDVALALAHELEGEIVSADSMQIYKGMDIGTAKPSSGQRAQVPHHCIDVINPDQPFTVADYAQMAHEVIGDVHMRGKLPILTGGTGLYIRAVLEDLLFADRGADWDLRRSLEATAREKGNAYLHQRLAAVDPETAARLHANDVRRVVRALEVYQTTGKPLSQHIREARGKTPPYDARRVGLTRQRAHLYHRIEARVDEQIDRGLVDEVRGLWEQGYNEDLTSMQALGYKEILAYLQGRYTLAEAVQILKRDTRRYAKRQLSWFGADRRVRWVDLDAWDDEIGAVRAVYEAWFQVEGGKRAGDHPD